MKTSHRLTSTAFAGLMVLGAGALSSQAMAAGDVEKCAGIAKAGKNDCATSKNQCHGQATTNSDFEAWIELPKGTCEKIAGAHVTTAANINPKK